MRLAFVIAVAAAVYLFLRARKKASAEIGDGVTIGGRPVAPAPIVSDPDNWSYDDLLFHGDGD